MKGLIVIRTGGPIFTSPAYNRLAVRTGAILQLYSVGLYAANGKTIKIVGLPEQIEVL